MVNSPPKYTSASSTILINPCHERDSFEANPGPYPSTQPSIGMLCARSVVDYGARTKQCSYKPSTKFFHPDYGELRHKDVPFLIRLLLSTKEIKAEHEEDLQDPSLSQYKREYDVAERRQIRDICLEYCLFTNQNISLRLCLWRDHLSV